MEFKTVINNRKSIRSYESRPIPDETLNFILKTAQQAPSWMNKQCWHFIIINNPALIKEIAKTTLINRWVKQAPMLIIACADPHESGSNNNIDYYTVDVAIAMQHIVLAATDQGLGTCWIGSFNEQKLKNLLEIPPRIRVVAYTPLGYPKEKQTITDTSRTFFARSTKRKPLPKISHYNSW